MAQNREIKSKQFVSESGLIDGSGADGLLKGNDRTFEGGLGNHTTYADAAGTVPVDMTGGSPNVTLAINDTTPLNGNQSARLSKDAVNRQGEGMSVLVDVPEKFRGMPTIVQARYKASANIVYGNPADPVGTPGDIGVHLYDVTNSKLLTPNVSILDGSGLINTGIQIPSDCEQLRLGLHIQSTSALAFDLDIDDIDIIFSPNQTVSNSSDWIDYTPVTQGLGTISSNSTQYRVDGKDLLISGKFIVGTRTASELQVNLPPGMVVDSSVGSDVRCGSASWGGSTTTSYATLMTAGDNFINMTHQSVNGLSPALGNAIFSDGSFVSFFCRVPIEGRTSGTVHPAAAGLNAQAVMRAYKNGGAVTANTTIASWTGKDKDTTDSFDISTGIYTVKSPGDYLVTVIMQNTVQSSDAVRITVNGTQHALGVGDGNSSLDSTTTIIPDLKYGDEITVQHTGSVTLASTDNSALNIYKLGSNTQPYAPRVAYVKDVKPNNTTGGAATAGSWNTRTLNTLEGDESFISLSSNQFTLQPGTYQIEGSVPARAVNSHKSKVRDITNGADIIIGQTCLAGGAESNVTHGSFMGTFTITTATTFAIQQRVQSSQGSGGLGWPSNLGVNEVYTQAKITKVL